MISIVITAHNEGDNLRRTVDSILASTGWPTYEIILLDDGSSDDSFAFLGDEPYCSDARLQRYRFERSVGLIRARHEGIRWARGDYITILDAHIAVVPGWLTTLAEALGRWGPYSLITPDISMLDNEIWSPTPPMGQIVAVNENLDMVWRAPLFPTGLVPIVLGACWIMARQFYFQVGGFDLGLRRWGLENVDLGLKVYAAGGVCYCEPGVLVGHLFRGEFPYAMSYQNLTYNKLRVGYVHFSDGIFRRLLDRLAGEPGFAEAMADFQVELSELDRLRQRQQASNRRDPDWFVRLFLPGLIWEPNRENGQ
jgi:glycosyltransferase involved in cell wall biosynthesis